MIVSMPVTMPVPMIVSAVAMSVAVIECKDTNKVDNKPHKAYQQ
jgi:hypothetical protein